jgi:hypothetical protein
MKYLGAKNLEDMKYEIMAKVDDERERGKERKIKESREFRSTLLAFSFFYQLYEVSRKSLEIENFQHLNESSTKCSDFFCW